MVKLKPEYTNKPETHEWDEGNYRRTASTMRECNLHCSLFINRKS